ncbi:MAG: hypothetical protein K9L32_12990 [Chromatiaceae bacterium]|nr:hypothetical protein [Chromatiaceae bacterium]
MPPSIVAAITAAADESASPSAKRLQDPERADARSKAQPDKGWDYDPCAEPTEGLRQAIAQRIDDCEAVQFSRRRKGKRLSCIDGIVNDLKMQEYAIRAHGKTPEPRILDIALLPSGLEESFYIERFMSEFNESADGVAMLEAPTGEVLSISSHMFQDHKKGGTKISKRGRAPYLLYLAETIKAPDEIWAIGPALAPNELRLLSWYKISGEVVAMIAGFRPSKRTWEGWTGYQSPKMSYVNTKREGRLVYVRTQ